MPINDFLQVASAGGANVMSQSEYLAETARQNGVTAGTARSALANKSWRQSAAMAAAVGQFINDFGGLDALDDGNIANLEKALVQTLQAGKWAYVVATGTANAWVLTPTPAVPAYAAGRPLLVKAPATNTSTTVNANVSSLGNRRIKRSDGTDPAIGDLVSGQIYPTVDDGTSICVSIPLPSQIVAQVSAIPPILAVFTDTTPGTRTYTPTVTGWYRLEIVGAGAGGGGGVGSGCGGGGGGGGRAIDYVYLIAGTAYTYTVGAKGVGGAAGFNGTNGGSSSVVGPAGTIVATGGSAGVGANVGGGGSGGSPGSGSGVSTLGTVDPGQSGFQGSPQIGQSGQGGSSPAGGYGAPASFALSAGATAPGGAGAGGTAGNAGSDGAVGRLTLQALGG